ncbi:hypothetical protein BKA67DRAFT_421953 [Truncatella angustata]|uniref:Zn(2)-C6 fungal-type domain-containing protein n=1 Tax=Truncatella angustata TaxID=152316 RepID=A0A9P8RML2_9PEZI|nr:uncharacterized protein BKA67DRAFT_421953 [Truncatella angustata]KAH6646978.1 hypothetical protein BKA67DRAFT_421953 [Truncatella angustata]
MQPIAYPPILPAPPAVEGSVSPLPSCHPTRNLVRKRVSTSVACNVCRLRKIRCDSERPTCSNCKKARSTGYVYRKHHKMADASLIELLELFRAMPEDRAAHLLTAIQNNSNTASLLSTIETNTAGTPSITASGSSPSFASSQPIAPVQNPLESELMAKNPNTYPALSSIVDSDLARSSLIGSVLSFAAHHTISSSSDPTVSDPTTQNF